MSKIIPLPFGTVHIHSQYMIVVMNEGITVTPKSNTILQDIINKYYKNRNLVYIAHRLNSYAVDPRIYFETSKIQNLLGIAIVTGNEIRLDSTEIERLFYNKPFKTFESLDHAILWAKKFCAENKSN
ncbi:MAG: hypothetical protein ABI295_10585 [Xanthomarina sp.]